MQFAEATRQTSRARVLLFGPTGFGKSVSSLLIAKGLTKDGSYKRILMIDTEHGRGKACVGKKIGDEVIGKFLVPSEKDEIKPPYTTAKLIQALMEAESSKMFDVVIVDSMSHWWAGKGGLLEQKDDVHKANTNKNQMSDWAPVTKDYLTLVEAILQCDLHLVMTCRSKSGWDYVVNEKGVAEPKILGFAPVMRDGFASECGTILSMVERGHAICMKDDSQLLPMGEPFVPTVDTGAVIKSWYAENEGAAAGKYGLKSDQFRKCTHPKCNGLCEFDGIDTIGDITVRFYRCKENPVHVIKEKIENV